MGLEEAFSVKEGETEAPRRTGSEAQGLLFFHCAPLPAPTRGAVLYVILQRGETRRVSSLSWNLWGVGTGGWQCSLCSRCLVERDRGFFPPPVRGHTCLCIRAHLERAKLQQ